MNRFKEILALLEKLPKEANYFGTVDKLKYAAEKGIEEYPKSEEPDNHRQVELNTKKL